MARYMVRMDEIEQSMRIIEQAIDKLPDGPIKAKVPKGFLSLRPVIAMLRLKPHAEPLAAGLSVTEAKIRIV